MSLAIAELISAVENFCSAVAEQNLAIAIFSSAVAILNLAVAILSSAVAENFSSVIDKFVSEGENRSRINNELLNTTNAAKAEVV